jgi:hypothetical protein
MMSILTEINSRPSAAIKFALDGLDRLKDAAGYEIDMYTFGDYRSEDNLCVGCAATAAIQEMCKKDLTASTIYGAGRRAQALGLDRYELVRFEQAIDLARVNCLERLGRFCDCDLSTEEDAIDDIMENWVNDGTTAYSIKVLELVYSVLTAAAK